MPLMKRLCIIGTVIFLAQMLHAQTHSNSWFRSTVSIPFYKNLQFKIEFQHRRQNGVNNSNLFDKNLQFAFRNWIQYKKSDQIKFSLSPFAYFSNYKMIQHEEDELAKPSNEIRFSGAVESQNPLGENLFLVSRIALEYRFFDHKQPSLMRLRSRLGFRYIWSKNIKLNLYDELLVNTAGAPMSHFFDHNRMGFSLEITILKPFSMEFGYLRITRLPTVAFGTIHENNYVLNLKYLLNRN